MDYIELIIAVISMACSAFLFFKNRGLSITVEDLKKKFESGKILYIECPHCHNKIYLTLDNIKEEENE